MQHQEIKYHSVRLQNLEIGYDAGRKNEHKVFGPLSLESNTAEMVCLIGRNGVGKSTLLRTIAGLQAQIAGKVCFDNMDINKLPASDRAKRISYVSTEPVHVSQMKAGELIALGRTPHTGWFGRLSDTHLYKIHKAAELTGIHSLLQKHLHELSDGERQKVMIARALAQDTPVIVLDEPTAFLDLPSRYEIVQLLSDLTMKAGKTILFSTHDLSMAIDVADKIWLMTDKEIYEGAPEDLLINGVFRKLFDSSSIEFDSKTSVFRFIRKPDNTVLLTGEKKFRMITVKALERVGFTAEGNENCKINIHIKEENSRPCWELEINKIRRTFHTVYDMTVFLKKLKDHDIN